MTKLKLPLAVLVVALLVAPAASAYSQVVKGKPGTARVVYSINATHNIDTLPSLDWNVGSWYRSTASAASQYICSVYRVYSYDVYQARWLPNTTGDPDCTWVPPGHRIDFDTVHFSGSPGQGYRVMQVVTWQTKTRVLGSRTMSFFDKSDYQCQGNSYCEVDRNGSGSYFVYFPF